MSERRLDEMTEELVNHVNTYLRTSAGDGVHALVKAAVLDFLILNREKYGLKRQIPRFQVASWRIGDIRLAIDVAELEAFLRPPAAPKKDEP